MKLDPGIIQPSQDFLKPHTIKFIFECIRTGKLSDLPPTPIVRRDNANQYIAIDGHNLIAVKAYLHEEIEVHVATNADDGLPLTSQNNRARNVELTEKYELCINESKAISERGVYSFQDWISSYRELFDKNGVK